MKHTLTLIITLLLTVPCIAEDNRAPSYEDRAKLHTHSSTGIYGHVRDKWIWIEVSPRTGRPLMNLARYQLEKHLGSATATLRWRCGYNRRKLLIGYRGISSAKTTLSNGEDSISPSRRMLA